jgi:hypothetical protein
MAWRSSRGQRAGGDDDVVAWIWTVRYLRAVLTNLRMDQPVLASIRLLTARAATRS